MNSDFTLPTHSQQDEDFLAELENLARPQNIADLEDFPTAGALAKALNPMTVQTPALDLIDAELVRVDQCIAQNIKRNALFKTLIDSGVAEKDAAERAFVELPHVGTNRLCISMPPQEGKTTRVTQNGVLWVLRRHPNLRIALVSYQEQIAQANMSRPIRTDIENFQGQNEYTIDLGLRMRPDNRSVGFWNLDKPHVGGVYAVGVGGALTGRPVDLMLIDDPVKSYQDADSLIRSEMAWNWWQSVARTRLAPNAPVVIIMTRWHEADLVGRLLQKQKEDEAQGYTDIDSWRVINIPAQADHRPELSETDVLGRDPSEYMVSARGRTQVQWQTIKNGVVPRIWSALYQGKPTPDSGDVFQRSWWMRYETPNWTSDGDGICHVMDVTEVIQSWDMTFKDNKGTDFVVGQVWARKGANAYLVDQVRGRMSFTATLDAFRRLSRKWPQASAKFIEDKANGPAVISTLRHEIGGIIPVEVSSTKGGSKPSRAAAVSPFIESHNVWIPAIAIAEPGFDPESFIEECTQFPNSAHDDQVDAMSQALARMFVHGSGAKDWLESLVPPCSNCGQPNAKGTPKCSKCGADLPQDEATEKVSVSEGQEEEQFSLTSGVHNPNAKSEPTPDNYTQRVQDLLADINPTSNWLGRWQ